MTIAVVTGANRGIGLELCRALHERGERVVALCRTPSSELEALGVRVERDVDVTDHEAVRRVAGSLGDERVGLLINNAGVLDSDTLASVDADAIRRQLEINAVAPLFVTSAFLPRLSEGSKVALITSRMGSIADNDSGGYYGYRMSKAALNAAGKSLAIDLRPRGIAVVTLHPGFVRTDMTGNRGNVTPEEAARGLLARIDELTVERTGEFRHQNGEPLPW